MKSVEELRETTLARAASTVGPASGLAESSIARPARSEAPPRNGGRGHGRCAAAAVLVASMGGGPTKSVSRRSESPSASSVHTEASSTPSAGAQTQWETCSDRLQVVWAVT